jgi:ATP-dependent DNA ligase
MASTARTRHLPDFIAPMLAKAGGPFDSDEHLFEIKWDGTRMLTWVENGGYRLVNRWRADRTDTYPELAFLAGLPAGTVLDGEVVVLRGGKPDFRALLARENSRSLVRIRASAQRGPVTYVVFDLLYERFTSLMHLPLWDRRRRLEKLVQDAGHPQWVFSQGVVGAGRAFFEEACRLGLEGVVAKHLESR